MAVAMSLHLLRLSAASIFRVMPRQRINNVVLSYSPITGQQPRQPPSARHHQYVSNNAPRNINVTATRRSPFAYEQNRHLGDITIARHRQQYYHLNVFVWRNNVHVL